MWDSLKALFGMGEPDSPEVAAAKQRMEVDASDPRKRFVWCMIAISTSEKADPGHMPAFSNTAIREWYGLSSPEELRGRIDSFLRGTGAKPAYDAFRAIFLARAGFGAGMLSDAESWEATFQAARKCKQAYPSWNHYGTDYIDAHVAYRRDSGDAEEALQRYRRNHLENMRVIAGKVWPKTPYETPV